jgi:orotate phosphoribosyltransferase
LTQDELKLALRDAAYLEGDFVLRSGKRSRYYLDKYRFETRPDLLAALGERIARTAAEFEPDATRLAAPELGAVALAAAGSLASGLPFLIVRNAAKEYGTSKRVEGLYEEGECVCLVEDVVTSGGALLEAVQALREVGLGVRTAVCVVDREEGGADALARQAVRLRPIFRASDLLEAPKIPAKPHG